MAIFRSYVSLPEGIHFSTPTNHGQSEVPMKKQPDTKVLPVTASGHQL